MKKFIFTLPLLLLLFAFSYGSREYNFIIHLADANIEYKKEIYEFHIDASKELHVYPKETYTIQISDKKLYVIEADPKRSGIGGVFFVLQHNNNFKGLDYIYDTFGDSIKDVILFDLDKDLIDEIITIWGDEESFRIRVDKFDSNAKGINIFNSARLLYPYLIDYKRKMLINKGSLLLLYSYQYHGGLVNKKAMLTINSDDPTKEIFLVPLGKVDKDEWLSLEKQRIK